MRAGTLAISLIQVSCQILEQDVWFNILRDVMKAAAGISLGDSGASNCWTRKMKDAFGDLQNGTVYKSDFLHYRNEAEHF